MKRDIVAELEARLYAWKRHVYDATGTWATAGLPQVIQWVKQEGYSPMNYAPNERSYRLTFANEAGDRIIVVGMIDLETGELAVYAVEDGGKHS